MEDSQFIHCAMIWEYCTYVHKMSWVGFSSSLFSLHIDRISFYRITNDANVSMKIAWNVQIERKSQQAKRDNVNFVISFLFGALIYHFDYVYHTIFQWFKISSHKFWDSTQVKVKEQKHFLFRACNVCVHARCFHFRLPLLSVPHSYRHGCSCYCCCAFKWLLVFSSFSEVFNHFSRGLCVVCALKRIIFIQ